MEENVALDSKKQRKFNKSIKGIKKLLKKNEDTPHKPAVLAPKDDERQGAKKKRKRPVRGLVYLSHIPHGFYEHEMSQYFKQFGMVTNVRVIRSPRTGRSKGFAFVEFKEPAVAEIVAETMNNYLMGKRLIKAAIIPPEKQKSRAFRKFWTSKNNPTANRRLKARKAHNANKTDEEHLKQARKMLSHLRKTKKKLNDLGINYDFFKPVDVPAALLENAEVKEEKESNTVKVKKETEEKQNKKKKNSVETKEKTIKKDKEEAKQSKAVEGKTKKEVKKIQETDRVKQNEKQKKMKEAGVKLPENFIKIAEEEDECDSSLNFDSDEYEEMLAEDSDASSGEESDDDNSEDDEEESGDDGEESDDGGEESDDDQEESEDEVSEEEIPQLIQIKQEKVKKSLVTLATPKKAENSAKPQIEDNKPKKGPKQPNVQGQKGPKQLNGQDQKEPKPQNVQGQKGPKQQNLQGQKGPKQQNLQGQKGPKQQNVQGQKGPKQQNVQGQKGPKQQNVQGQKGPKQQNLQGQKGPKQQNVQGQKGPKPQYVHGQKGPKSPTQGQNAPSGQQGVKRKNFQPEFSPKKPKFEKKDSKPRNKQFKKKNKA